MKKEKDKEKGKIKYANMDMSKGKIVRKKSKSNNKSANQLKIKIEESRRNREQFLEKIIGNSIDEGLKVNVDKIRLGNSDSARSSLLKFSLRNKSLTPKSARPIDNQKKIAADK